ncbi:uncharacterized protein V1516DRAFT_675583 [Lipomyces oligophaga]|uniref:uncharacterized protein n=1 Tax=Lipomyces oligophaga TaxID=45792 RepID=UPI0034CE9381
MAPKRKPQFHEVAVVGGSASAGGSSVSRLKKKIRDLERLLSRDRNNQKNTAALARREQERALAALKYELNTALRGTKKKKLEQKYHHVRFFERRKADRKVNQSKRALKLAQETGVERDIQIAKKNYAFAAQQLIYIVLFPESEKYISLYAGDSLSSLNSQSNADLSSTEKSRLEWWREAGRLFSTGEVNPESLLFGRAGSNVKRLQSSASEQHAEPDANVAEESTLNQESEDEFFES